MGNISIVVRREFNKGIFRGQGGCRPYDYVMMFKILILQWYYNISDDKMPACRREAVLWTGREFAILDRLSFMRFLGLSMSDRVPDAKTIWNFRKQLRRKGIIEKLFSLFTEELQKQGLIANEGKIVDASFIKVPIQRNTRQENKEIKEGNVPEQWNENPHKMAQKDTDARWTKKNGRNYYGYKNHIKADAESNRIKSKVRARIEHIFGFVENSMNGSFIRTIGIKRDIALVGLMNLTYPEGTPSEQYVSSDSTRICCRVEKSVTRAKGERKMKRIRG